MDRVAFTTITTCMGRLDHIKQMLPRLYAEPNIQIILVDWSCPQHTGDWVKEHYPRVKVVSVPGQQYFNHSAARNAGAAEAETEWLCFIDADTLVTKGFSKLIQASIEPNTFTKPYLGHHGSLTGFTVCEKSAWEAIKYNEKMEGWGLEDAEFDEGLGFLRKFQKRIPYDTLEYIEHDDNLRTQYSKYKLIGESATRNEHFYRKFNDNNAYFKTMVKEKKTNHDHSTPSISCMCLTYARPKYVVEEAIYSFLQQDYAGQKELIVLNDFDQQTLIFDHPEVKIINVPKRFRTVGEKRNACAALSTYDMLAVWDDDDIYLPHRLTYSMKMYNQSKRYFKPSKAWMLNDGVISGPKSNLYHSSGIWHRSLFDEVRGYAHMGSGQDMEIELKYEKVLGQTKNYNLIKPEEIFYVYRWSGTGSYHLSGFGTDKTDQKTGNDKVSDYAKTQVQNGKIMTGTIHLEPKWHSDYLTMVKQHIDSL